MKLGGIQKMTLLDFPGHVACTVFTSGCDFRCPFCHNSPLIGHIDDEELIDSSELMRLLDMRKGILDGVAITGGEPLMHPETAELMEEIGKKGFLVKLDTNGSYPERLADIIERKLADYVAMDVKSPLEKYALVAGTDAFNDKIKESIALLLSGNVEYEFRTTAVAKLHEKGDFEKIGQLISGAKRYYIQCFKDSGNILEDGLSAPTKEELLGFLREAKKYVPNTELRGVDL